MSFFSTGTVGSIVSSFMSPTKNLDEYIEKVLAPRFKADPTLLPTLKNAIYYNYDAKNPPPNLACINNNKSENSSAATSAASSTTAPSSKAQEQQKQKEEEKEKQQQEEKSQQQAPQARTYQNLAKYQPDMHRLRKIVNIRVVEADCLAHTRDLVSQLKKEGGGGGEEKNNNNKGGCKVACMNAANEFNVGGAFSIHNGSQEEYLFRNCTLPISLWHHRREKYDEFRAWHTGTKLLGPPSEDPSERWYKWTPYACVYTPKVEVFAVADQKLNSNEIFECAIISTAAQDLRKQAHSSGEPFSHELLLNKLRAAFHAAYVNGAEKIILNPIGCGAFLNAPADVAHVFAVALEELSYAFPTKESFPFKVVDFAIIKSKQNLETFQKQFEEKK